MDMRNGLRELIAFAECQRLAIGDLAFAPGQEAFRALGPKDLLHHLLTTFAHLLSLSLLLLAITIEDKRLFTQLLFPDK